MFQCHSKSFPWGHHMSVPCISIIILGPLPSYYNTSLKNLTCEKLTMSPATQINTCHSQKYGGAIRSSGIILITQDTVLKKTTKNIRSGAPMRHHILPTNNMLPAFDESGRLVITDSNESDFLDMPHWIDRRKKKITILDWFWVMCML